nr:uncharacterized protein LOC112028191 [Quercus suber]
MEGGFDEVALNTFKLDLPADHGLRKSLTGKPVTSVRQLMDKIDKYKRFEEDQQKGKAKDKVIPQERRDYKSDCYSNNKQQRDFVRQSRSANPQAVNDYGHTTEDCRSFWDHLEQLIREGKLKQLLHHSNGQGSQASSESRRNVSSRPPLGTINVIFAALGRTGSYPSRIMSVALLPTGDINQDPKRAKTSIPPVLGFSDEDKIGTIQPHDNALVITLKIWGYDVKKTGTEVVEVDFIVVDAYSPYTVIVARPWLHTLGAVSSTLHQKVKYPSEGQVNEILGDQSTARQCLVATIQHKPEAESLAYAGRDL